MMLSIITEPYVFLWRSAELDVWYVRVTSYEGDTQRAADHRRDVGHKVLNSPDAGFFLIRGQFKHTLIKNYTKIKSIFKSEGRVSETLTSIINRNMLNTFHVAFNSQDPDW